MQTGSPGLSAGGHRRAGPSNGGPSANVPPLLTTKLYIPPVLRDLVPRPRLIERLNEGLHRGHRLSLISAPAGFGKTTLLSEWVATCGRPVAWLALDSSDNDPARFLAYLIAALQTIDDGVGAGVLDRFQVPRPPPIEELLTALINQIDAISTSFVLVLDDYHLIMAPRIHEALAFLLDHPPQNMHLVVATRADPPWQFARLRGRGQLTELRLADLQFTPDEATVFLNQVMGLRLSADDITALTARTEGWIAGLQLAALSMQDREDLPGFIAALTGCQHYILDYLVEEVLHRQSESVQAFLLRTSILDRLTGPLCDALTLEHPPGAEDGQTMLNRLQRANLFVLPLDESHQWYRYHHLFADSLRVCLEQAWPDQVPKYHRRASRWYEQHGYLTEAIEHALSADDLDRAACLIEQAAEPTLMRSEFTTFLSWVEALPEEVTRARPLLNVYYAGIQLMDGSPLQLAEARLQEASSAEPSRAVASAVAAFQMLIAAYRGDTRQSVELSQQALALLAEDNLFLRSLIAGFLGITYLWSGDFTTAASALGEAIRIGRQIGNLTFSVLALCHLAELHIVRGQLHKAGALYEQALERATDSQGRRLPIAGIALVGTGYLLREWNDLEAARRHLVEGLELAAKWEKTGTFSGYISLAGVEQALGDQEAARGAIRQARQVVMGFDGMEIASIVTGVYQARLSLQQGNHSAVIRWAGERGLEERIKAGELEEGSRTVPFLYAALEYLAYAEARIAQGQPDEALATLSGLLPMTETGGWTMFVIETLALEALAFQRLSDAPQAMCCLERALSLAEPEGFVRTFVDRGPPMAALLEQILEAQQNGCQALARGIAPDYVRRLLDAFGKGEKTRPREPLPPPSPPALVEPLSKREVEVLRLLATDLTSPQMARELVVSVHTVRSHIKSIYAKLNAHSRYEALARATELNLL
jgi:LuxR family maltose regulon positive regulatory protein